MPIATADDPKRDQVKEQLSSNPGLDALGDLLRALTAVQDQTVKPPAAEKVVLFADMLGFTDIIEHHEIDLQALKSLDRLHGVSSLGELLRAGNDPLAHTFHGFHFSLRSAISLAEMSHPLTAITFSDSAFIATELLHQAASIAAYLVRSLLPQKIPLRVGIAHGSFAAVRFRSDVTADSGDHAAHFLGKGVVHAHRAETCGIKGIRILLHPSAAVLLNDPLHNPTSPQGQPLLHTVECDSSEMSNRAEVALELDYWQFGRTAEAEAWHALQDMWTAAPEKEQIHYLATARAVDKMRMAHGEAGLKSLRRRTLPRAKGSGAKR